ncbi:hypothetical protein L3V79_01080 [Thiotrichales bacterium 19S9-12]|nr:hypothetical protein [Thiotrichales bacterium 19S9-11]MCF6810952.1 hypothetical protein [Thiotrichales bacterium 19S9-12]
MIIYFLLNSIFFALSFFFYALEYYDSFALLLVFIFFILSSLSFALSQNRVTFGFWFAIIYIALFLFTPVLDIFGLQDYKPSHQVSLTYQFLAIGGGALFQIGYSLTYSPVSIYYHSFCFRRLERILFYFIGLMLIACYIWYAFFGGVNINKSIRLEHLGGLPLLASYIMLFAIPSYIFWPLYLKKRPFYIPLFVIVFAVVQYLDFAINKSRSDFVSSVLALLLGQLYVSKIIVFKETFSLTDLKKPIFPSLYKMIMLISPLVLVAAILRFVRGQMQTGAVTIDVWSGLQKSFGIGGDHFGSFSYGSMVYKLINYVPTYHDWLYGQSYYRLMYVFIPRSLWNMKPQNTETIVGGWLYPNIQGMVVPPGVIGDAYINFGNLGVLMMLVIGVAFAFLTRVSNPLLSFLFPFVAAVQIFHFVRGSFTTSIVEMVVVFLSLSVMYWYVRATEITSAQNS